MRELDVLLTRWLDQRHAEAGPAMQQAFIDLLACEDDQLWDWLLGRAEPPANLQALVTGIQRLGETSQSG